MRIFGRWRMGWWKDENDKPSHITSPKLENGNDKPHMCHFQVLYEPIN
jgi:hypothetical protein